MFRKLITSKWIRYPFFIFITGFDLIGLFFSGTYVAMKFKITNELGEIDINDRYFQGIQDKYTQGFKIKYAKDSVRDYTFYKRLILLNDFCPVNASYIFNALSTSRNELEAGKMIDAVELNLQGNKAYQESLKSIMSVSVSQKKVKGSIFEWMNIAEWQAFKGAVEKDHALIDSVAELTGVESRLIVSVLVGEQIRLFNSNREAYKKWIAPLKILSVETKFSFGVTGIKEHTAIAIEQLLKNSSSVYYLGKQYEHLLDFKTSNHQAERMSRLTSYRNHFYSYMYAALFMKQVMVQWEKSGFSIADRPEILATLFNVGYIQSKPKKNPRVGGSSILIHNKKYSFGAIAYEFYYSGELFNLFPFKPSKFDWNSKV